MTKKPKENSDERKSKEEQRLEKKQSENYSESTLESATLRVLEVA